MNEKWYQEPQNQFALSVVLIIAVAIIGLIIIFNTIDNQSRNNPCWHEASFECKNTRVQECLKSEQYTKDQCVILIGGAK